VQATAQLHGRTVRADLTRYSNEFKSPSKGDIFTMGGISNYRLKNIQPESDFKKLNEVI
jgi:hypothetical protein